MWIQVGSLHTKLMGATDEERSWVSEYLAFDDASARFRKLGRSDGRIRMFQPFNQTFPSGFVPMVERAAKDEGFALQRVDTRVCPTPADPQADLTWLRDYQLEAVEAVKRNGRGILWLTTGAGKTEIAVALALVYPVRWVFLAHSITLMDQAASRYEKRTNMRAGRIGEGSWDVKPDDMFVCSTFQTLSRRLEKKDPLALALLGEAGGLVVDECHTLPAGSFYRVAMSCPAYWRVGLSGTPLARGDKRSVLSIAALGPVIYRLKTERLVDAGILAKPTIRVVEVKQKVDKPTYQGVYGEAIVRSPVRNRVLVEMAKRAEKPALVFVKEIAHGKALTKMIEKAGMNVEFVWGNSLEDHRKRACRDLMSGRLDVLVCSVVFQEGVDLPELRSVVIGSGGKSIIAALQRIGRGMRKTKDKDTFEVWDIKDSDCGCGGKQHAGCRWLRRHSGERIKAYVSEKHEVVDATSTFLLPVT